MAWWFLRNALPLRESHLKLVEKGLENNVTKAQISVTIKYTAEFISTLGLPILGGMHHIVFWTIKVNSVMY